MVRAPARLRSSEFNPCAPVIAILDEAIPAVDVHGDYWPEHDDLRSITCASDIVFIGRVTGYTQRLLTVPPAGEDPDPSRLSDILDGLVFTVDELLIGDLGGSAQVTVAFLALTVDNDRPADRTRRTQRVLGSGPYRVHRSGSACDCWAEPAPGIRYPRDR